MADGNITAARRDGQGPDQNPAGGRPARKRKEQGRDADATRDFGIAGTDELDTFEAELAVRRMDAAMDSSEENRRRLIIAEKRLELFRAEHDNAGAFKFKRFGRETVSLFEDRPGKPAAIARAEDGRFVLSSEDHDRRLLFVNMGELDRVNKEGGGHAAGDAALRETVRVLERAIAALPAREFGRAAYTILRYRGNEFMVSFERLPREDFDAVLREVAAARPEVPGVDEPPPLVAEGFDVQEGLDILNQLQLELGEDERIDPSDAPAAAREFIEVMRRRADYALDAEKFLSRIGRVKEKVAVLGEGGAKAFFDNYMKKNFEGTGLADIAAFASLSPEEAERLAFDHAGRMLSAAGASRDATRAVVDARIREIRAKRATSAGAAAEQVATPRAARLAVVPERTVGQQSVETYEAKAVQAEATGASDARVLRLEAQIESARRDKGTGLLERGSYYETVERDFAQGRESSVVFVDMGFLRYFDNRGGADVGNAALKVAAQTIEDALARSGVRGEAYRYGGDEFTVRIDGGAAQTELFRVALEQARAEAGAIPVGKRGTADGYHPTELVFNAGTADTATAEAVFASLREAGAYDETDMTDPERVVNAKAELMTIIADKGIEREKAVGRFAMLIDALRDPSYATDPDRKTQVDLLISFSNKALLAEAGGAAYLRALAASDRPLDQLRPEIESWVSERAAESRKKELRKDSLLDSLVEIHAKIRYYERALAEQRHETEEQRQRGEKAVAELAQVRDERRRLIEARKTLGGGVDK